MPPKCENMTSIQKSYAKKKNKDLRKITQKELNRRKLIAGVSMNPKRGALKQGKPLKSKKLVALKKGQKITPTYNKDGSIRKNSKF